MFFERLEAAEYTSPDGQIVIPFSYEELTTQIVKKTTAYDFPDADGTFVQDLGLAGRRFPLRIYLHGDDYDLAAQEFERALEQAGPGTLSHPTAGPRLVVPFGTITRREDLSRQAGQAVYEIVFYETLPQIYPEADPVALSSDEFDDAAATDFEENTGLDSVVDQAQEKPKFLRELERVKSQLDPLAQTVQELRRQFESIYESIVTGVDILLGIPATLAFQVLQLIKLPITAAQTIENKIRGYRDLILTTLAGGPASSANDLQVRGLIASGALAALAQELPGEIYRSRAEAVQASAALVDLFLVIAQWRDERPPELQDGGESYQRLLELVTRNAQELIRQSFDLAQERAEVLAEPETIVELAARLYGDPDQLDQLINENNFTGSEILLVPEGRRVVYYV